LFTVLVLLGEWMRRHITRSLGLRR
jgi:hypothetical protein